MVTVVMCIVGMVAAFFLGVCIILARIDDPVGTVHIDRSDPDGTYLFLELEVPVEDLAKKSQVMVRVEDSDLTTRK